MFERFRKKSSETSASESVGTTSASPASASTPDAFIEPKDTASDSLSGVVLSDRYRVIDEIGEGGMGRVYRAEQTILGGNLAIKVLNEAYSRRSELRRRFLKEAQAASQLNHENVVKIFDFGETPTGSVFFAMEYLQGEDLGDHMLVEGRRPWEKAKNIIVQISRALIEAHQRDIVHRDIKPANCFLIRRADGSELVKLLDFGIAKIRNADDSTLTEVGTVLGTASYMAPEQAKGAEVDTRADIYAVGVILYQLLTGRVPFTGDNVMAVIYQLTTAPVPPPSEVAPEANITPAMEALLMRALEKDPTRRFQTMREFLDAVLAVDPNARPIRHRKPSWPLRKSPVAVTTPAATATSMTPPPLRAGGTQVRPPTTPPPAPIIKSTAKHVPSSPPPPPPVASDSSGGGGALKKLFVAGLGLTVAGVVGLYAIPESALQDAPPEAAIAADAAPNPVDESESEGKAVKQPSKKRRRRRSKGKSNKPDDKKPQATKDSGTPTGASKQNGKGSPAIDTGQAIENAFAGLKPAIRKCARQASAVRGTEVKVHFGISSAGKISSSRALGRHAKSKLGRCLLRAVRGLSFPNGITASTHTRTIEL